MFALNLGPDGLPDMGLSAFLAGLAEATAGRPGAFLAELAAAVGGPGVVTVDLDGQECAVVLRVLTAAAEAARADGHYLRAEACRVAAQWETYERSLR